MVEVVNIVASTQYASTLDLTELADHIGIIFEPEQFPGMIWKMKEHSAKGRTEPMPKATILTFASGKSVVVGARTVEDIESAFAIMREQLVSGDFEIWDHPHDIALRNLVIVHQIGSNLDLKLLSVQLPFAKTEYEPEQFPGLIYRQEINGREAVCLIFSSGKCVITGCASFEDAEEAAETLAETLGDVL